MTVMVTGANGMIGTELVKALQKKEFKVIGIDRIVKKTTNIFCIQADLEDQQEIRDIIRKYNVDRIIHLAALAHTEGEPDLSWDRYYHTNVECANNIFKNAGEIPVLFISTIDVYGFYDGKKEVTVNTRIRPISNYGKSKALAENECKKLSHYMIFRLSPVYSEQCTRDIQKRYYLKYPNIAYRIGKGSHFEVLNINRAVHEMVNWCNEETRNEIRIIKDPETMWTPDYIKKEKAAGRAKRVFIFPRWLVVIGYTIIKKVLGENEKTYLLNKAVYPLKTTD